VTVFLASIDAARVPERVFNAAESERIETVRVTVDAALTALAQGTMRNGPFVAALQWLALNRGRIAELLGGAR
jgi:ADP-ribose pyrophosphatase